MCALARQLNRYEASISSRTKQQQISHHYPRNNRVVVRNKPGQRHLPAGGAESCCCCCQSSAECQASPSSISCWENEQLGPHNTNRCRLDREPLLISCLLFSFSKVVNLDPSFTVVCLVLFQVLALMRRAGRVSCAMPGVARSNYRNSVIRD